MGCRQPHRGVGVGLGQGTGGVLGRGEVAATSREVLFRGWEGRGQRLSQYKPTVLLGNKKCQEARETPGLCNMRGCEKR